MTGHIYLVQEREFIKTNENIYKIGRTFQLNPFDRIKNYPKGTMLHLFRSVSDPIKAEKKLINIMKKEFIHRKDIGSEYFEGNLLNMTKKINSVIDEKYGYIDKPSSDKNDLSDDISDDQNDQGIINEDINNFIKKEIVKTDNNLDFLTVTTIYTAYKKWSHKDIINLHSFGKEIKKTLGPKKDVGPKDKRRKGWNCIILIN